MKRCHELAERTGLPPICMACNLGPCPHWTPPVDELTRLRTEVANLRATLKQAREYEALYHELIMLVGNKYPNETRHETAKRYIASVEIPRSDKTGGQAAIDKVQPINKTGA